MNWFPDWREKTVCLLASGPTLTQCQADAAQRFPAIAINTTWQRAPWAPVLYACDQKWWKSGAGQAALQEFGGLMVTQDDRVPLEFPAVRLVQMARNRQGEPLNTIQTKPGRIGSGANGGFQALNLAIQFGARRILLLGYDMRGGHWHGAHGEGLNNPDDTNFAAWRGFFAANVPLIHGLGVEVINCTPGSALTCFPAGRLEDF